MGDGDAHKWMQIISISCYIRVDQRVSEVKYKKKLQGIYIYPLMHQPVLKFLLTEIGCRMPSKQRIVVKIGTSTLTGGAKKLSAARLVDLARQMGALQAAGSQVVLVSSGAMAAGREVLGFPSLPKYLPAKQMLAAVGQPRLMAMYEQVFTIYDTRVAQEADRFAALVFNDP